MSDGEAEINALLRPDEDEETCQLNDRDRDHLLADDTLDLELDEADRFEELEPESMASSPGPTHFEQRRLAQARGRARMSRCSVRPPKKNAPRLQATASPGPVFVCPAPPPPLRHPPIRPIDPRGQWPRPPPVAEVARPPLPEPVPVVAYPELMSSIKSESSLYDDVTEDEVMVIEASQADLSPPGSDVLRPESQVQVITLSDDEDDEIYFPLTEDIQIKAEPGGPPPIQPGPASVPLAHILVESTDQSMEDRMMNVTESRTREITTSLPPMSEQNAFRGDITRDKFQKPLKRKAHIVAKLNAQHEESLFRVILTNLPQNWDDGILQEKAMAHCEGKVARVRVQRSQNRALLIFNLKSDALGFVRMFQGREVTEKEGNATFVTLIHAKMIMAR